MSYDAEINAYKVARPVINLTMEKNILLDSANIFFQQEIADQKMPGGIKGKY